MSAVATLPAPAPVIDREVELLCSNGHRTTRSLAGMRRLNDLWCGKCGADLSSPPQADADGGPADIARNEYR